MTIQDQIDQLKKEFEDIKNIIVATHKGVDNYKYSITGGPVVKPTLYYPNGAYMDEPEEGSAYFFVGDSSAYESYLSKDKIGSCVDLDRLKNQNCFPTREAAEKELKRQKLTAKMYRDMRDERINGDWVADWKDETQDKYFPKMFAGALDIDCTHYLIRSRDFFYKKCTFIEDLKKFLNWTEEELKIVWFRV